MWHIAFILFLWTGVHSIERNTKLEHSLLEQQHNVYYSTYTKESPTNPLNIRDVHFNAQTTVFIVHGYTASSLDGPLGVVDNIFKYRSDVSRVVVVSWSDYACGK